jgi:glycosyltransferase involved in cell wall biosynthesis
MNITMIGAKNFEDIGGIENHIKEISKRLAERGHCVNVIINNNGKNTSYELLDGINVYSVPYIQGRYTTKLSMLPSLLYKAKKLSTDIYHAHDVVSGFGSVVYLNDKPIVYTAHGIGYLRNDWPVPIRLSLWAMEQILFRRANKLLTVDYQTKNFLEKIRRDVQVTVNGVDLDRFEERKELPNEFDPDRIKVVFAARLIPTKGAHLLINSFREKDAMLYIIGKGPEEEKLKRLISKKDNVKFIGFVHDVVPYLQHADIFVLPSFYEGLPIALLEAMAAETACISFRIGDLDKRFKHMHDIYFTSREGLSDSISKLVANDHLRIKISKNAKKKIFEEYNWNKTVGSLIKVYDSVNI